MKEPKAKSLANPVLTQMLDAAGRPVEESNQGRYVFGTQHKRKREVYETTGDYQGTSYARVPTSSAFENFGQRNNQQWIRDQRFNTIGDGQAFHRNPVYPGRQLQDYSNDEIVFAVDQDLDKMINYRNNMPLARQGVADRGQYQPPPQEGFETLESTYGPEYVNSVLKRWCNRSWPAQELKTLVNAINEGKSFQQAAKLIPKKSVQACRIKAKRLLAREPGLFSRQPGQRKYRRAPKRRSQAEDLRGENLRQKSSTPKSLMDAQLPTVVSPGWPLDRLKLLYSCTLINAPVDRLSQLFQIPSKDILLKIEEMKAKLPHLFSADETQDGKGAVGSLGDSGESQSPAATETVVSPKKTTTRVLDVSLKEELDFDFAVNQSWESEQLLMLVKLIRERTPILQIGKRLRKDPHLVLNKIKSICENDSRIISKEQLANYQSQGDDEGVVPKSERFRSGERIEAKMFDWPRYYPAKSQKCAG